MAVESRRRPSKTIAKKDSRSRARDDVSESPLLAETSPRCGWARNELAIHYHDEEWGVPLHDDRLWFEALVLDGAQAGLSWDTILRKRENYRKAFIAVQKEFGSFDVYIWQLVGGSPRANSWREIKQVPARTAESDAMSKDLIKRGFKFVGSTICYALMQATGLVNDHLVDCFRYEEVKTRRR